MNNTRLDIYPARARSDPSLAAGVRGDPKWITALRGDPPEHLKTRGHPPEVRHTRNGPPADSARGKPPEMLFFRKWPRAESRMNGHPPESINPGKIYFLRNIDSTGKRRKLTRMGKVCSVGILKESQPYISFRTVLIQVGALPLDSDARFDALPESSEGTTCKSTECNEMEPCGSQ